MKAEALLAFLRTHDLGRRAVLLDECTSTQTLALERARTGAPHGLLVYCEKQTAGRGRHGRQWLAGEGSLTFSVVLSRGIDPAQAHHYSFIAGLAMLRTLARHGRAEVQLKWPNDLWWRGVKVGGLLASLETQPLAIVLGVGLNLSFDPPTAEPSLRARAGSLDLARIDRAELLANFLLDLEQQQALYLLDGAAPLLAATRRALALRGEKVHVSTQDGMLTGTVIDLGDNFNLRLTLTDGHEVQVALGEVWPFETLSPS